MHLKHSVMEQLMHLGLLPLKDTYRRIFESSISLQDFLLSIKNSVGGTKITYFKVDVEQKNDLRINYSNEQHLSSSTFYSHLL